VRNKKGTHVLANRYSSHVRKFMSSISHLSSRFRSRLIKRLAGESSRFPEILKNHCLCSLTSHKIEHLSRIHLSACRVPLYLLLHEIGSPKNLGVSLRAVLYLADVSFSTDYAILLGRRYSEMPSVSTEFNQRGFSSEIVNSEMDCNEILPVS